MANRRRFTGDPSRLPPLLYQANRLGVCTDRVALGVDSTWAASRPTGPRPRAGRSGCGQGSITTFGLSQLSVLLATVVAAAETACERVQPRLDRQAETLRVVWKQCGGRPDAGLPLDDWRDPTSARPRPSPDGARSHERGDPGSADRASGYGVGVPASRSSDRVARERPRRGGWQCPGALLPGRAGSWERPSHRRPGGRLEVA